MAIRLDPNSPFAEDGAAIASGLLKNTAARIQHYRRAAEILPNYWEARLQLGIAQAFAEENDAAEQTFQNILREAPPLPVQEQVYGRLVYFYTDTRRRRDAAA